MLNKKYTTKIMKNKIHFLGSSFHGMGHLKGKSNLIYDKLQVSTEENDKDI